MIMIENIHRLYLSDRFQLSANYRPIHIHTLIFIGLPAHEIQVLAQPVTQLNRKSSASGQYPTVQTVETGNRPDDRFRMSCDSFHAFSRERWRVTIDLR